MAGKESAFVGLIQQLNEVDDFSLELSESDYTFISDTFQTYRPLFAAELLLTQRSRSVTS